MEDQPDAETNIHFTNPLASQSGEEAEEVKLPMKLSKLVSHEKLLENARNYPEMGFDLDPELVSYVRDILLLLPLVHRTDAKRISSEPVSGGSLYDSIVPQSYMHGAGSDSDNTFELDRDLDLDEFVFMAWGAIYPQERGHFLAGVRNAALISSSLLLDPRCIVSPDDISSIISYHDLKTGIKSLDQKERQAIQEEYLDKLVTGRDWLEIEARRIAKQLTDNPQDLDIAKLFAGDLGEIKFFGEIPRSKIIAIVDTHDKHEYDLYRKQIEEETGFILAKVRQFSRKHLR
ncbi:hypothetical protein IT414_04090 [bacterium]|nr:hypothetical protein [bacterium]